ncbi:hypothetical protein TCAL_04485 [Tigriopus californicus]|uniref:Protein HID1 n=1 Tax=Tigriopus californicus TaxID=6832 RepID=A0A553NY70_TIGCA|nr:protein HID1-like [Tigriopus californicus]TRY70371.1 hypothetical protein TCAL_04485 [Tigriopus californicus]|eukprot:TCALIF_04485-PA protein Name:"Similar to Hid1 Protein HID1 (Mus musculus)" AED:0.04 eAED:0.04 QI:0/1/0/1/1/1/2/0/854
MGNTDTKLNFRKAVIQLTTKTQPVDAGEDSFWEQFWSESVTNVQDVFTLVPSTEIRALREESPSNLATLCYKAVEKLVLAADASCRTQKDHIEVLNSVRLLTRLIPYIFEEPEWRSFFWSSIPESNGGGSAASSSGHNDSQPLAQSMLNAVCDLLFCPEFTVAPNKNGARDEADDLQTLDSCEYIWASGVGFAHKPIDNPQYDLNRRELLRLLQTCFSQSMYLPPVGDAHVQSNRWVQYFTSSENRHALPLFTSLLNIVCGYDPGGILPYNHLLFHDSREELVDVALQVLIVTLDQEATSTNIVDEDSTFPDNLFLNYLSRIHREEDFDFILKGVTRLLMNPLAQTYLPNSQRKVHFHQELLIFFWKFCEHNKKFLFFVLKSSDVLDILTPILHHLNDARADQSRVGLMHIGVFILLLLSGERNFGVRLNKPYTATIPMDIPVFTGTHADLLIIVFHKIITTGHQRLQPLFDCLLTILCNVSPYIKSMSMIAACKLIHLLEAFTTPWFLFSSPTNHHLVFFILEIFNNIIQYQFDGNSNLVYSIIRKRQVFHHLANLPTDCGSINKTLTRRGKKQLTTTPSTTSSVANANIVMEGAKPALPAEPGTLKASLMDMPGIENMTEKESAHPSQRQLDKLTRAGPGATLFSTGLLGSETQVNEESEGQPIQPTTETDQTATLVDQNRAMAANLASLTRQPSLESASMRSTGESLKGDTEISRNSVQRTLSRASEQSVASSRVAPTESWVPTQDWVASWKVKLPLQTIMRLLQVLVPQVEKICIDKGLTDESEILRFLQHGTLVGLLPVPHPILIRKYQPNPGTAMWFRTYMWGVIYLRNTDPPIWYDTDVKLFEIQRV